MGGDEVRDRILTAAVETASIHGVARLSMADVARQAGLSRPTLYKHFASKDELFASAVLREAEALVEAVLVAAASHDEPRASLEAAILAALRLSREHPLLDRLVRTEPDALLPLLTTDSGPVMVLVRGTVERVIAETLPALGDLARRRLADMITRLLVSYAVTAPDDPPELVAAALAGFLVDGVPATALELSRPKEKSRR